jgi:hypothetical protein
MKTLELTSKIYGDVSSTYDITELQEEAFWKRVNEVF